MDVEAVTASGTRLVAYKNSLHAAVEAASTAVRKIAENWGGPDSVYFQSEWATTRIPLTSAGENLNTMATECKTNAEKQKGACVARSRSQPPVRATTMVGVRATTDDDR